MHISLAALAAACVLIPVRSTAAQDPVEAPPPPPPPESVAEEVAVEESDGLTLKNGDRLTGTITAITPDGVAISTEVLGDQIVPLANVADIRSSGVVEIAVMRGEVYSVYKGRIDGFADGVISTPDREIRTGEIVATRLEGAQWTSSIAIGASASFGNTERRTANADVNAIRRTEENRLRLRGNWNYADETNSAGVETVTQRQIFGSAQWDEFIEDGLFAYGSVSGEGDELARLRSRFIFGAGLGYQVIDDADLKLSVEGGLSYVNEDNQDTILTNNPPPALPTITTANNDAEYLAARLAASLTYDITEDLNFASVGEMFPSLEDSDDFTSRLDSRIRYALSDNLFAQFQWIFDFDNTPAAGQERADHLLVASIGWNF